MGAVEPKSPVPGPPDLTPGCQSSCWCRLSTTWSLPAPPATRKPPCPLLHRDTSRPPYSLCWTHD